MDEDICTKITCISPEGYIETEHEFADGNRYVTVQTIEQLEEERDSLTSIIEDAKAVRMRFNGGWLN